VTARAQRGDPRAGTAVVIVLGALLVLSAMGLALALLSATESMAGANLRRANAALYAAEAGIERALPDLVRAPDWDEVLGGRVRSGFTDGPPEGARVLPDGRLIDLGQVAALANCGAAGGCSSGAMDAVTVDRPWGANNPRWTLFAYGPLSALLPAGPSPPPEYLVVLVADDPSETDGDPRRDGRAGTSPGAGVIQLRAEAFGPQAAHRVIEVTVARGQGAPFAAGYAAQRGQGSADGGRPGSSVQVPGGAIARSELAPGGGMSRQ
jgi:hypothetical protein